METGNKLRLADVFVSITDPRQAGRVEHDLIELLVVAVNAVQVGADTFVEIELWAKEKLDWLRGYLRLEAGIPSHDTFDRLFGLIDPAEFEAAFRRWVGTVLPALGADAVVAIDGKTSRAHGQGRCHTLASDQRLCRGCWPGPWSARDGPEVEREDGHPRIAGDPGVGDAMGTQSNMAQAIRHRGADYVLAVKDNQPTLADALRDFFTLFKAAPDKTVVGWISAAHPPRNFCHQNNGLAIGRMTAAARCG